MAEAVTSSTPTSGRLGGRLARVFLRRSLGHQRGLEDILDRLLGDHARLYVAARRQLELNVGQGLLEDRAQPAGAGFAVERAVGDRLERVVGEDQLDPV